MDRSAKYTLFAFLIGTTCKSVSLTVDLTLKIPSVLIGRNFPSFFFYLTSLNVVYSALAFLAFEMRLVFLNLISGSRREYMMLKYWNRVYLIIVQVSILICYTGVLSVYAVEIFAPFNFYIKGGHIAAGFKFYIYSTEFFVIYVFFRTFTFFVSKRLENLEKRNKSLTCSEIAIIYWTYLIIVLNFFDVVLITIVAYLE